MIRWENSSGAGRRRSYRLYRRSHGRTAMTRQKGRHPWGMCSYLTPRNMMTTVRSRHFYSAIYIFVCGWIFTSVRPCTGLIFSGEITYLLINKTDCGGSFFSLILHACTPTLWACFGHASNITYLSPHSLGHVHPDVLAPLIPSLIFLSVAVILPRFVPLPRHVLNAGCRSD